MIRKYTDRSRIEQTQRCARSRWYGYHESGLGLSPMKLPLPLAVGKSVHKGLEQLLRYAMEVESSGHTPQWDLVESGAVELALADFRQHEDALALDLSESQGLVATADTQSFGALLGVGEDDAAVGVLNERVGAMRSQFDKYLAREQASLVEAMVRAYARRRLRPLLEQYEVLEVEREGEWKLADLERYVNSRGRLDSDEIETWGELWFMSRPDALLRERATDQLYLLSFKTTAGWDVRRAKSAEHDMQGLTEGIEIERRLSHWWELIHDGLEENTRMGKQVIDFTYLRDTLGCNGTMFTFLQRQAVPPRILAIRYEYLIKGERWKDKDLSARLGLECRSQRSHLVRGYCNVGLAAGDEQWNWSWDYLKDTGESSNLYCKTWKSRPVWESMPIKRWIDMLDDAAMLVDAETGSEKGFKSDAQATGATRTHPLDDVFLPPIIVYRGEDELRDLVDQIEAQEVRVAQGVEAVNAATDEGERRHLLNVHFAMNRHSCYYPSQCIFTELCYGGEDVRSRPLDSGLYRVRVPNHPQELE